MTRTRRLLVAATGAILLAAAAGAVFLALVGERRVVHERGPLAESVFFDVPKGASARGIASRLLEEGVIADVAGIPGDLIFREHVRRAGRSQDIKFWNYEIPARASMAEVLDIITDATASLSPYSVAFRVSARGSKTLLLERVAGTGEERLLAAFRDGDSVPSAYSEIVAGALPVSYRVTVPEGLTSWQIARALESAEFLSGEIAEDPEEGMLAPDTYEVERGADRMALLARMEDVQSGILNAEWERRSRDLPVRNLEEALILASIVEKETGVPEERGLVGSVFVNRLEKGMRLQTDPSVIYGITGGREPLERGLRKSELKRETPYNTYLVPGLPPTPIANPGAASIRAALHPEESDYLFFVADGSGGHAFAVTYAEHRKNVREWRKHEAERKQAE